MLGTIPVKPELGFHFSKWERQEDFFEKLLLG
jgi:hypothetical protein